MLEYGFGLLDCHGNFLRKEFDAPQTIIWNPLKLIVHLYIFWTYCVNRTVIKKHFVSFIREGSEDAAIQIFFLLLSDLWLITLIIDSDSAQPIQLTEVRVVVFKLNLNEAFPFFHGGKKNVWNDTNTASIILIIPVQLHDVSHFVRNLIMKLVISGFSLWFR